MSATPPYALLPFLPSRLTSVTLVLVLGLVLRGRCARGAVTMSSSLFVFNINNILRD